MRWLVVVVTVSACTDDNGFRRIEDIPQVKCGSTSTVAAGHVYGELKLASGTRSFGAVTIATINNSATAITIGDGEMTLNLDVYSQNGTAMYHGDFEFASASSLVQDCGLAAGRFEMLFDAGDLSGWYWASTNGW